MISERDWLDFEHLVDDEVCDVVKPPSIYKVILVSDDYTPMELVIDVLQKFLSYDVERATQLILTVHYEGKATYGMFTAKVVETRAAVMNQYARENEHPLLRTLEKA